MRHRQTLGVTGFALVALVLCGCSRNYQRFTFERRPREGALIRYDHDTGEVYVMKHNRQGWHQVVMWSAPEENSEP